MSKVKVYIAANCAPCHVVKGLLEKGHFLVNGKEGEIDLIDIETEEGFKQIFDGLKGVPAAYHEGKECRIFIDDDETLRLECQDGA